MQHNDVAHGVRGRPTNAGIRRRATRAIYVATAMACLCAAPHAIAEPGASPTNEQLIRPLPVFVAQASEWAPQFPFPYDRTRNQVTAQDIRAEGEMCQWFVAQYATINDQIGRLQFNRISPSGDWDYGVDDVQQQVGIVTSNIDQALDFLAPRAQSLTQAQDFAGDVYFPVYGGQPFYGLWQQLSNVNNGIKAHQPDWFTAPSYVRMKRLASEIHRSHVCD